MTFYKTYNNAYEMVENRQGQLCSNSPNILCCPDTFRSISYNSTAYDRYTILDSYTEVISLFARKNGFL